MKVDELLAWSQRQPDDRDELVDAATLPCQSPVITGVSRLRNAALLVP
jgi:hypothetical protein